MAAHRHFYSPPQKDGTGQIQWKLTIGGVILVASILLMEQGYERYLF